jgi:hypothetical protein
MLVLNSAVRGYCHISVETRALEHSRPPALSGRGLLIGWKRLKRDWMAARAQKSRGSGANATLHPVSGQVSDQVECAVRECRRWTRARMVMGVADDN